MRKVLRYGVRRIGQGLFRIGGLIDAILENLDKVADMDPAEVDRRIANTDSAFDGIGEGEDRWWI